MASDFKFPYNETHTLKAVGFDKLGKPTPLAPGSVTWTIAGIDGATDLVNEDTAKIVPGNPGLLTVGISVVVPVTAENPTGLATASKVYEADTLPVSTVDIVSADPVEPPPVEGGPPVSVDIVAS